MTPLLFIIAALAVYRVSHMVAREDGPFDAFTWLRTWVLNQFGNQSWVERGVNCPNCVSFWLGLVVAPMLLWQTAPVVLWWLLIGLALSGVTVLVQKVVG